ncbi:hypothetical protein OESDEN_16148 [Oesophagostomum dentatum]|uniref:Uncharacterized protein n=1 Tax=Oesophagostomum dentatum TaxID=61180 RepID=A0A0B1SKY4_OESDE|nr:hypothetical protein OESDEN_16148 [Oesophagostomum dentatum]
MYTGLSILKYFNPQLIGCNLSKGRHYFIGRILNTKEGVKSYTTCKNAKYCSKDDNDCKISWKEGPNYVFVSYC